MGDSFAKQKSKTANIHRICNQKLELKKKITD